MKTHPYRNSILAALVMGVISLALGSSAQAAKPKLAVVQSGGPIVIVTATGPAAPSVSNP